MAELDEKGKGEKQDDAKQDAKENVKENAKEKSQVSTRTRSRKRKPTRKTIPLAAEAEPCTGSVVVDDDEEDDESRKKRYDPTITSSVEAKLISSEKGQGLVAVKSIRKGDYIGEYYGARINGSVAIRRAVERGARYLFEFQDETDSKTAKAIDAENTTCMCRLLNHSRKNPNVGAAPMANRTQIHFFATKDIAVGEELLWDYGDYSKESLKACPWLDS